MAPHDPTADEEPDFKDEVWEGTRAVIMGGGKMAKESVELLRLSWIAKHNKDKMLWAEHIWQEQEARQAAREEPGVLVVPVVEHPEKPNAPDWRTLSHTPSFLDIKPARHVLKRLEKKDFVELWHFTSEGCSDAATMDLATPNDTFGLVDTENCLVLQMIGATTTSPKVIRDKYLSWVQLTKAKTRMIGCMKSCRWNKSKISQLVLFYLSLDVHPICARPYGLEAVMHYQEQVHCDWTSNIKNGTPYQITQVNNKLIKEFREQIGSEIQVRNNVSLNYFLLNCQISY